MSSKYDQNTQTDLTIRQATLKDVPLIQKLVRELAVFEKLEDQMVATDSLVEKALFSPESVAECLIAEWKGEPAGCAIFFHNYSTFLARPGIYLEDLFVREHLRGNGIGKAMLERLAKIAVERNCGRFEWSVLDWNESAIRFYESLGAEKQSGWSVYRLHGEALERLARFCE